MDRLRNIAVLILFVMSIGQLLHLCEPDDRIVFRRYEKAKIKLLKSENRVSFNTFCDNEGVLPRYLN